MGLPEIFAGLILIALVLYAVLGGADFGGGVWDLVATGPRAKEQRALIERAIAPVWEANHVWLILAVVLLFTAFPPAFSTLAIEYHVPLVILLVGIVFRGSAFVFRQYGGGGEEATARWGRVFAIASTVTPVFIGITVGAVTAIDLPTNELRVPSTYDTSWLRPFPILVGLFTLAQFAFVAAVYLTNEAETPELQNDFRWRGIGASLVSGVLAGASALTAGPSTAHFSSRLIGSTWTAPLAVLTTVSAVGAIVCLQARRYRVARVLAVAQVALVIAGWGAAQYPYLIGPSLTVQEAAAPPATLKVVWPVLIAGSVLLLPSLYWMLRVFKRPASR
ncbi:MAG: cytochrome d ubiquinol oxidase subunit II [Polyangiaceae bacterium]|nr:cytochrome d ubiquinol oxidase subunit II [Polyangiaceae bacterium]